MKRTLTSLLCAALLPAAAFAADKPAHWSYEGVTGPQNWAKLEQDFSTCTLGHNQSPIDIRKTAKAKLPPLEFSYSPSPLKILDNGHTIQVNYAAGSSITIDGKRYELLQFHFHKPSEEKINGRSYPMVAHLVHRNEEGKLAVVAVLFRKGADNPLVQTLWDALPKEKGEAQEVAGVNIDIGKLLPAAQGYYNFAGSLTTPPCSEEVNWFVLKTPVEMSDAQLKRFAHIYKHNARPTQPLNGRTVQESL
ncbi:carbonic anhydrase [Duganella sp. Root1480D1]|uniref:carbonic anhydrase n=1 Tax=Duganella sp. Root1480D1 TaxID=1736471 RepID=UPI00070D6088|nr:carbonic anhydrase family protein [Duganella sp. Root1480D1]KQZ32703.1 carbonate dehydratase [Duganella sp. Root1480D1]